MTDLVSRLRAYCPFDLNGISLPRNPDGYEAADRIEKLEAEVERLRAGKNECEREGCTNRAEYCLSCLDDATNAAYVDGSGR